MRIATFRDAEIAISKIQRIVDGIGPTTNNVIDKTVTNNVGGDGLDNIDGGAGTVIHNLIHKFRNKVYFGAFQWDGVTSATELDLTGPTTTSSAILKIKDIVADQSRLEFHATLAPQTTNVETIGDTTYRWKELYLTEWDFKTSILPKTTNNVDLGDSSHTVRMGYFRDLTLDSATASRPVVTDGSKKFISALIDLASTNFVTGILKVTNGGTGVATVTSGSILVGAGTSAMTEVAGLNSASIAYYNSIGFTQSTLQYKDWAGVNQSLNVLTSLTLSVGALNISKGVLTSFT